MAEERWDIIPDIHADQVGLNKRLELCRPDARRAFLGDFIDAKNLAVSDDRAVLEQVRYEIENGAVAVLGNHELNAILFHTTKDGRPLREHIKKNKDQHASFIAAFGTCTPKAREWADWFLTIPLWRETDGFRLVHGCWSNAAIAEIERRRPDGRLQKEDLEEVSEKKTPFAKAVELLVSGPEMRPCEDFKGFTDINCHCRFEVRLKWWRSDAVTWRDAAMSVRDLSQIPDRPIPKNIGVEFYSADAKPVFFGHYKLKREDGVSVEADNACCLDYTDLDCIYHWSGEQVLTPQNIKWTAK